MDPSKLGCGDTDIDATLSPRKHADIKDKENLKQHDIDEEQQDIIPDIQRKVSTETITLNSIEDHENRLKDRISQCRNIIDSLKQELREEKVKVEKETKNYHRPAKTQATEKPSITTVQKTTEDVLKFCNGPTSGTSSDDFLGEFSLNTDVYSARVEGKLTCDENLMEYEKQLEQYQTTLNMAQIEKKNAIRKQMLTKAYRLKLLELENQCNIELLRVKQSLQCLEPLKMIANKWNTEPDENTYDLDKYELLPPYPELSSPILNSTEFVEDTTLDQIVDDVDNNNKTDA